MDRREALQRISFLMGGVLSASTVAGVLGGCQLGPREAPWIPQTLTPEQDALVTTITELIIPETDTPGARAARVNEFIDLLLTEWYPADEREHFLQELATVDVVAQDMVGKPFMLASPEEQTAVLVFLEEAALALEEAGTKEPPFFTMMKGLTLSGYYTSEVGATQELKYMPMGTYDGAVPYEQIGRSWS